MAFLTPYPRFIAELSLPHVEALLEKEKLRPVFLFDTVRTRRIHPEEVVSVDPKLRTLRNLNTRDDYLAALAEEGLSDGVCL